MSRRTFDRRVVCMSIAAFAGVGVAGATAASPSPLIKIHKDPGCTCCSAWADHLTAAGFKTEVVEDPDMPAYKASLGIPKDLGSCHTGVVSGYVIEGHVPAADITRLLKTRPAAKGLAVPGMTVNSPGMEMPGEPKEPYTVWLFQSDGKRTAFAEHGA